MSLVPRKRRPYRGYEYSPHTRVLDYAKTINLPQTNLLTREKNCRHAQFMHSALTLTGILFLP
jgi:hypothetical protein